MQKRRLFLTGLFSSLFTTYSALGDPLTANGSSWFPYIPRFSGTGWVSNNQDILQGDAMAALFGNDQNILWGDLDGKNSLDSSWSGGLGAGYRYVYNCERILGAYLFGDSSRALNGGHTFYDLSPGIESMGRLWDFRINGYFPVNNKNPLVQEGFADNTFDQFQFTTFSGHNQYSRLLDLYQTVGNGVDGEVGRLIVPGLTAYAGGYYFSASSSSSGAFVSPQNVKGVSARAQYEFNSYTALEVSNTYDNVLHDTILGGIRFTLGGMNNSSQDRSDISSRLLDPIERELATQGQGVAVPVQNQLQLGSGLILEKGNIWFFEPGGSTTGAAGTAGNVANITANSCTFEHPCSNTIFDQNTVDQIAGISHAAIFYLNTGDYNLFTNNQNSGGTDGILHLRDSQSTYGRQNDFYEPGQGSNRPTVDGRLDFPTAGTSNIIDSIQLFNDTAVNPGGEAQGISLDGNTTVTINNSLIGSLTDSDEAFATGIKVAGSNNILSITGSSINAYSSSQYANGIYITGSGNTFFFGNSDTISALANSIGTFTEAAYGINEFSLGSNTFIFSSRDTISAVVTGASSTDNVSEGIGILFAGDDVFTFGSGDIISANSNGSTGANDARGISDESLIGNNIFIFGDGDILNATARAGNTNNPYGVFLYHGGNDKFSFGSRDTISTAASNANYGNYTAALAVGTPGNIFTFGSNDTISANASNGQVNRAYGVRANQSNNTFTFARGDQVMASGNVGQTVGLYSNSSGNTWNNVDNINFTLSAGGQNCGGSNPPC